MQFLIFKYSFQGKYVYNIYVCMQYIHPKSLQMLDLASDQVILFCIVCIKVGYKHHCNLTDTLLYQKEYSNIR